MKTAIITGAAGLIGSEAARFFAEKGYKVVGIDNDMRRYFFGDSASTAWNREALKKDIPNYIHKNIDIRNYTDLEDVFKDYVTDIAVVIHAAAQPSHDWAAREPFTDFAINANGTLNLLELTRKYCPQAVFIFTSTNKVYGDTPNNLPLIETETRWEIEETHPFFDGIDESMSIDQSKHSLFGASKVAADILVQEYGRYFDLKTACFRGGCLTGPNHSGAQLHGFLSFLMKCCMTGEAYTVFGYKGKQVRDNIHSYDMVNAFYHFVKDPQPGAVYNMGGGRTNSCSVLEAIYMCEEISGKKMNYTIVDDNRAGDHMWYISSLKRFEKDFPEWQQEYTLGTTCTQIFENNKEKWV